MLDVDRLTVAFGSTTAVRELSLRAEPGAVTGLLGVNGAGKTTTLLGILGLVPRRSGRIILADEDVTGYETGALIRAGLSLCPENRRLFPDLSVEDNLLLGAYGVGRRERRTRLSRCYDRFPLLRTRRAEPAGRLSGGQQQSVAIARALMSDPKLLLLDEPSSGLSPVAVHEVGDVLESLIAEGTAVLLVEQSVELVKRLCSTVWILARGGIAAHGPAADLLRPGTYLGTSSNVTQGGSPGDDRYWLRSAPHYLLGGPATGRPASGSGMTVSPCRTHGLGGGVTGPEASKDR